MSLLILAVFWNVGEFPDLAGIYYQNDGDMKPVLNAFRTFTMNISGTAFLYSSQVTTSASLEAVLQIPLQIPVMTRELSNKMYSPIAYYLGRLLSQLMLQFLPPTIMFLMLFWGIGITTSFDNLMWLWGLSVVGNFVWSAMGFWVGLVVSDESDGAKVVVVTICMIFMSVNGGIVNPE